MRTFVTALGAVSPYGPGAARLWDAARNGEDALRPVTRFDASPYRNTLGGEVPDHPAFDPLFAQGHDRAVVYVLSALDDALDTAATAASRPPAGKIGIVLGTNFGPMRAGEAAFAHRAAHPDDPAADLSGFLAGSVLDAAADHLRTRGLSVGDDAPRAMLSLSCASGAAALATALAWIRAGYVDTVLAGGFDELSETAFAGLSALRAISRDTVRPFDQGRDGTIFSEGAGVFLLESDAATARRGATPLAVLAGAATNNDAYHMTAPDRSGAGIVAVTRAALDDAGLPPDAIDHVNLHGTGTPYNDQIETLAMKTVFGEHAGAMAFTANKSLFGHAMGAAGALEAAITVCSIRDGCVPPTIRSRTPDPALDIPLVRDRALDRPLRAAQSNSYGLGGTNASVVFARP